MDTYLPKELVNELAIIIDDVYGTYLDAISGFARLKRHAIKEKKRIEERFKILKEEKAFLADEPLGEIYFGYGRLKRRDEEHDPFHLHQVRYDEYISRLSHGGRDIVFVANASIVTIFQFWEYYRRQIENALKIERDSIKISIFGDIRLLRNSVIHNRGKAIDEIANCEVLKWFHPGDDIVLDQEKFGYLIDMIMEAFETLRTNPKEFI